MKAMPLSPSQERAANIYSAQSDRLKELRELIQSWKDFDKVIGCAVQFRIVVDSNVVLGDIRWLAYKRKNEAARTTLIETIEAGTIEVYVPPALFDEVEEHMERIAREEGLDKELMAVQWAEYQKKLKVLEPESEQVQLLQNGVDPDDAVFLALAQKIAAAGIVSNDRHIEKMGGNKISVDCIVSLRNYSRSTAVELNIKVMGVMVGLAGISAIRGMFVGIKALVDGVVKAPDWLKFALIVGGVFCVMHPGAREAISRALRSVLEGIEEATPVLVSHIAEAASLAAKHKAGAQGYLDAAMSELALGLND